MPGRTSSIRPFRNTDKISLTPRLQPGTHRRSFRAERSGVEESRAYYREVRAPGSLDFARDDRANEAAVLIRLLYGRSEFVRAGNAVPLR